MGDVGSNLVMVTAPTHRQQLINQIWIFFQTKRNVDMSLLSAGRTIQVHRIVMTVFLPPSRLIEYGLHNRHRRSRSLDHLVAFLYRGWIALPDNELADLLVTARELNLPQLVNAILNASGSNPGIVSCPRHHDTLLSGLWYFAGVGFGTDTVIECAGRELRLHSLLANAFLSRNTLPDHYCPILLDYVVTFLYRGAVPVPENELGSLQDAARVMGFHLLADTVGHLLAIGWPTLSRSMEEEQSVHAIRIVDVRSCEGPWLSDTSGTSSTGGDESENRSTSSPDFIDVETVTPPCSPDPERSSSPDDGQSLDSRSRSNIQLLDPTAPNSADLEQRNKCEIDQPKRNAGFRIFDNGSVEFNVHAATGNSAIVPQVDKKEDGQNEGISGDETVEPFTLLSVKTDHTYPVRKPPTTRVSSLGSGGASRYVCDDCGLKFQQYRQWQCHRLVHLPDRPHQCGQCDWAFCEQHQLRRHMLVHSAAPFWCKVCRKPFKRTDALKKHELSHSSTTASQHPCDACDRVFRQLADLQEHVAIHELGNRKQYDCGLCELVFTCQREFNRHSQTQAHREKLSWSRMYRM